MPVITITRGSLRASQKLTDKLASVLNCRAISREMIIEHGKKYGIEEFMMAARKIMESKPPHSWDPHAEQIHHYLTMFKAALMDFVVKGDVIYHGLQTHFLLASAPRVLRLKVVAPMDYRVKALTEESNLSESEARDEITKIDEQRVSWAKFIYGENFDDPTQYDMILNMSKINLDAMVEVVVSLTRRPEFRLDARTMKFMRDAHMTAVVQAYLVRSPKTRSMDFWVDSDSSNGHVVVRRKAPSPAAGDWQKDIKDALAGVEFISSLEITESN
nr:cytidylate kinase-like family protein [candidate division Zixibacteria bacterium]